MNEIIEFLCPFSRPVHVFSLHLIGFPKGGLYMALLFTLQSALWGGGTIALLLGTGVFLTFRTRFFPIRNLGGAMVSVFSSRTRRSSGGGISSFSALMTALAATIGTGNIVGVAAALVTGGPGALVWMELSSIPALATKFSECLLSVAHRRKSLDGQWIGGPMYVMEDTLGRAGKVLAPLFSLAALLVAFSMGSMAQSNAMAAALERSFSLPPVLTGAMTAILLFLVSMGGIRSVSRLAEILVPLMAVGYLAASLWVIAVHSSALPGAVLCMLEDAFSLRAVSGGMVGSAFRQGVARGVLTHEAGLGSAAITAACAEDGDPLEQGLIAETAVAFDTFLLCTVTGLAICCSGVPFRDGTLTGAALTIAAFETAFGSLGGTLLSVAIALFAFSSSLGWVYQGETAFSYLFGRRRLFLYRLLFALAAFYGAAATLDTVFAISDICNALMCYPNLICLLLLSGEVARITQQA